jgi:uncharacterized protein YhaN
MSITSSIFIIKPIIDLLHEDVLHYVNNIKLLNQRIAELEKENAQLREVKEVKIKPVEPIVEVKEKKRTGPKIAPKKIINDDTFAKEAETFVEPVNEVVENTEKVVTVVPNEKTRKEYQQEYQRQYRKLKKEKQDQ